jgi:hypothetical protein
MMFIDCLLYLLSAFAGSIGGAYFVIKLKEG